MLSAWGGWYIVRTHQENVKGSKPKKQQHNANVKNVSFDNIVKTSAHINEKTKVKQDIENGTAQTQTGQNNNANNDVVSNIEQYKDSNIVTNIIDKFYSKNDTKDEVLLLTGNRQLSVKEFFANSKTPHYHEMEENLKNYVSTYHNTADDIASFKSDNSEIEKNNRDATQYIERGNLQQAYEKIEETIILENKSPSKDKDFIVQLARKHYAQASVNGLLFKDKQAVNKLVKAYNILNRKLKNEDIDGDVRQQQIEFLNSAVKFLFQNKQDQTTYIKYAKRAYSLANKYLSPMSKDRIKAINNLAEIYKTQHHWEKAEKLYQSAYDNICSVYGDEHEDSVKALQNLGNLYYSQHRYNDAREIYGAILETRKNIHGVEHALTLSSMNHLAKLLKDQGQYDESEDLYNNILIIRKKILGENHPLTLTSINNLAGLYEAKQEFDQAESLYYTVLQTKHELLGEDHISTMVSLNNLGHIYELQGKYEKASALLDQAVRLSTYILGENHKDTLVTMNNLAGVYQSRQEYKKAENLYYKIIATRQDVLGDEHPETLEANNNLATLYQQKQEYVKAVPLLLEVCDHACKILPEAHPSLLLYQRNLENAQSLLDHQPK